eukprot:12042682-Alexandrium_andersonii.AAC.1
MQRLRASAFSVADPRGGNRAITRARKPAPSHFRRALIAHAGPPSVIVLGCGPARRQPGHR